jgi:predicted nucleic acid-binding protein
MGLTVVDAGVIIGVLDANDAHHRAAVDALRHAQDRGDAVAIPASAYAEAMVGPSRLGAAALATARDFVARFPIDVVPLDVDTADRSAALRARHGTRLRLPDALVVATALELGAGVLVTTDRRWPARATLGLAGELVKL